MHLPFACVYRRLHSCKRLALIGIVLLTLSITSLYLKNNQQRHVEAVSEGVPYNTGKTTRTTPFTKNCSTFISGEGFDRTVVLSNSLDVDAQHRGEPLQEQENQVPFARIIHRMWKTSVVPDTWSLGVKKCREFNPDWLYCHWTDEELASFIDSEYPDFRSTYDAYPYDIQRSDAVRYLLLYHYGGLYLDLDIVCRLSFENILADVGIHQSPTGSDVILAEAEPFGVVSDFVAVRSRHDPFMRHVISGLRRSAESWYPIPYVRVMFSTGPVYLSRCAQDYMTSSSTKAAAEVGTVHNGHVTVVPASRYNGIYFGHLAGGSWHSWDGKVIWTVFRLRYRILLIGLCLVAIFAIRLVITRLKRAKRFRMIR